MYFVRSFLPFVRVFAVFVFENQIEKRLNTLSFKTACKPLFSFSNVFSLETGSKRRKLEEINT